MGKLVLCVPCGTITKHREKLDAAKVGGAVCNECDTQNTLCRLIKPEDVMFNEKHSKLVMWVEWNEDDTFKDNHNEPAIGRSLIMSPFNPFFTWKTSRITEILEEGEGYVKFRTVNSLYELYYAVDYVDNENDEDEIQKEVAS